MLLASVPSAPRRTLTLRLNLHAGQREVYSSPARFRVVACGRRWGKTTLATGDILGFCLRNAEREAWWVAPTYRQAKIALRMILKAVPPQLIEVNRSDLEITFWNDSRLVFRSADNPDALRGEGVHRLVVDEAAYIREETWTGVLRPMLSDTLGYALLISTFCGENWFYEAHQRGQREDEEQWASWRYPTVSNPFIAPEEVDEARRTLPKAEFEQEYEASPRSYVGAVFYGELIQAAIDRGAEIPVDDRWQTFAGLDWGYTNPTALVICRVSPEGRVHWIKEELWYAVELGRRCEEIAALCASYGVEEIASDAAGATEAKTLSETLRRRRLRTRIQPVPFGQYKWAAIDARRYHLERGMEAIGQECPELARDTKRYRYAENSTGKEEVVKENDHTVDAATAFYATRTGRLVKAA